MRQRVDPRADQVIRAGASGSSEQCNREVPDRRRPGPAGTPAGPAGVGRVETISPGRVGVV